MLAKFLKPNALGDGKNADDEYLARVNKYGDSTDANAQIRALAYLGIKAEFRQNLSFRTSTSNCWQTGPYRNPPPRPGRQPPGAGIDRGDWQLGEAYRVPIRPANWTW